MLLDAGADIYAASKAITGGETALTFAIMADAWDIVVLLLSRGAKTVCEPFHSLKKLESKLNSWDELANVAQSDLQTAKGLFDHDHSIEHSQEHLRRLLAGVLLNYKQAGGNRAFVQQVLLKIKEKTIADSQIFLTSFATWDTRLLYLARDGDESAPPEAPSLAPAFPTGLPQKPGDFDPESRQSLAESTLPINWKYVADRITIRDDGDLDLAEAKVALGVTNLFLLALDSGKLTLTKVLSRLRLGEIDDWTLEQLLKLLPWLKAKGLRELILPKTGTVLRSPIFDSDEGKSDMEAGEQPNEQGAPRAAAGANNNSSSSSGRGGVEVYEQSLPQDLRSDLVQSLISLCSSLKLPLTIGVISSQQAESHVVSVEFGGTSLSDAEMQLFAFVLPALCFAGLESLDLSRCGLSIKALTFLLPPLIAILSTRCSRLASVNINGNPFLSALVRMFFDGDKRAPGNNATASPSFTRRPTQTAGGSVIKGSSKRQVKNKAEQAQTSADNAMAAEALNLLCQFFGTLAERHATGGISYADAGTFCERLTQALKDSRGSGSDVTYLVSRR